MYYRLSCCIEYDTRPLWNEFLLSHSRDSFSQSEKGLVPIRFYIHHVLGYLGAGFLDEIEDNVADDWEAEATMLFDNNAVIDKRVEISYCCDSFLRIL